MLALLQWHNDLEIETVAVEFPIIGDVDGCELDWPLASCIDWVGRVKFDGKMVNAIVDFKTGKHFYDDHKLQLVLYMKMWNNVFGDTFPVTHIFNWRPKDWKLPGAPTYEFKNQTAKNPFFDSVHDRVRTAITENWFNVPRPNLRVTGKWVAGVTNPIDHTEVLSYNEFFDKINDETDAN